LADGNLGTARNEKFILVLLYHQQQITTYEERLTRVTKLNDLLNHFDPISLFNE